MFFHAAVGIIVCPSFPTIIFFFALCNFVKIHDNACGVALLESRTSHERVPAQSAVHLSVGSPLVDSSAYYVHQQHKRERKHHRSGLSAIPHVQQADTQPSISATMLQESEIEHSEARTSCGAYSTPRQHGDEGTSISTKDEAPSPHTTYAPTCTSERGVRNATASAAVPLTKKTHSDARFVAFVSDASLLSVFRNAGSELLKNYLSACSQSMEVGEVMRDKSWLQSH